LAFFPIGVPLSIEIDALLAAAVAADNFVGVANRSTFLTASKGMSLLFHQSSLASGLSQLFQNLPIGVANW
jgi:hypothetical protein